MLFNQLSGPEQDQVSASIARLQAEPDVDPDRGELSVLSRGSFRVIYSRQGDSIVIVDLFPSRQLEKLRSVQRTH
jgi:hypothetical protein